MCEQIPCRRSEAVRRQGKAGRQSTTTARLASGGCALPICEANCLPGGTRPIALVAWRRRALARALAGRHHAGYGVVVARAGIVLVAIPVDREFYPHAAGAAG